MRQMMKSSPLLWMSVFVFFFVQGTSRAATVRGTVVNKTTNRPGAEDDVVLIALSQSMQEIGRTKTDTAGHFTINVPDDGMHLIRVDHQRMAYFAPVTPGESHVNVTVYDVMERVQGITSEAQMIRMDTDGQQLRVVETYFVKNDSSPPHTQFGPKGYTVELPPGAVVDGGMAMGPGGMPVTTTPIPGHTAGQYTFLFPIRPGETRFQVGYHLRYTGALTFDSQILFPTAHFAVVLPATMRFSPAPGIHFEPMQADPGVQMVLAKNSQDAREIRFDVSGTGALPRSEAERQAGQSNGATPNVGVSDGGSTRPGGLGPPLNAPDPLERYKGWILGGLALLLAGGALWFLRLKQPLPSAFPEEPARARPLTVLAPAEENRHSVLRVLKEELFLLELEHLQEKLPDTEYREQKAALEIVLKRSLKINDVQGGEVSGLGGDMPLQNALPNPGSSMDEDASHANGIATEVRDPTPTLGFRT